MGIARAFITALTARCELLASDVASALREADVTVVDPATDDPCAPRVLAFTADSDAVTAAVADLSERGARRVLAVAGSRSAYAPWRLLHHGASDVVVWEESCASHAVAARLARWTEVDDLINSPQIREMVVGESLAWRAALRRVVEVARWSTAPVLITGESGTGKELIARLIHRIDPRTERGDLITVDGSAIVPTLSGSEFFGHERGAFTGAEAPRDGAFALADGGTLFLDEVGELPVALQAELLRVVQEGTYKRVGSNVWRRASFRLVCATNRDLERAQREETFRTDFYHRINTVTIRLPTLAERPSDVLPLFRYFLAQAGSAEEPAEVSPEVAEVIRGRPYPGNVRDLRALAIRVRLRHVGPGPITPGDLPDEERPYPSPSPEPASLEDRFCDAVRDAVAHGATLRQIRDVASEAAVKAALALCDGKLALAAKLLGVTDRALQLRRAGTGRGR